MRKVSSTQAMNEVFLSRTCELNSALEMISGKWKSQIVYSIYQGHNRFSLLKDKLPNISDQVLGRQLRELEEHCIIAKRALPGTTPPGIIYILTNKGLDVVPLLQGLCSWGRMYADNELIVDTGAVGGIHKK